jgi:hypothetical protein
LKHKLIIILLSFAFALIVWGSITLSDPFFSSYDFKVGVINIPEGYVCGSTNPKNIFVKVKAKGWQLLNLSLSPSPEFLVSAKNDSGLIKVDAYDQISENSWLGSAVTILDISPRNIALKVDKIVFKKLKVLAKTELKFQTGYGLATPIKIYPDSVLAAGPKSVIDSLRYLYTKPVLLKSLDSKMNFTANLEDLNGFFFKENNVNLSFDVQRIVDNTFDGIKVEVKNIPPDRDVVLIPNTISCSLRGGINIIGKVTPDQISAIIEYKDVILDTLGALKPKITIPNNTQLIYTKPEELQYIIKKFD